MNSNGKEAYWRGGRRSTDSTGWNPWSRFYDSYTLRYGSGAVPSLPDGYIFIKHV